MTNIIGIIYEEFVPGSYESVYLILNDGTQKIFSNGCPVIDFKDALECASKFNEITLYSSSVDNFIMDNPEYEIK